MYCVYQHATNKPTTPNVQFMQHTHVHTHKLYAMPDQTHISDSIAQMTVGVTRCITLLWLSHYLCHHQTVCKLDTKD